MDGFDAKAYEEHRRIMDKQNFETDYIRATGRLPYWW